MKQLFTTALVSLISGLLFAAGILLVLVVYGYFDSYSGFDDFDHFALPHDLRVVGHDQVEDAPTLTLRPVIENQGIDTWSGFSIEAVISAGGARVNSCRSFTREHLAPGERSTVEVECHGVAGQNLPDNISFEFEVRDGRRFKR